MKRGGYSLLVLLVSVAVLCKAAYICKGPTRTALGRGLHCTLLLASALNTASNVGWHSGRNALSFDL